MIWTNRRLMVALAFSLLLHVLALAPVPSTHRMEQQRTRLLEARLLPPPAPLPNQEPPALLLPPSQPPKTPPSPRKPIREQPRGSKPAARGHWTDEVKKQLNELDKQGRFYPEEAIARGIEGEVTVLLLLDESGNPAAARLEQSSGQRILDEAALRAVRSLKSLPATAPREVLLPVRFRLR